MSETLLFVYGTLRRGERAHGLLQGARELGTVRTIPAYELRNLGPYPSLLKGGSTPVVGELYAVPRALLRRIEKYEGSTFHRGLVDLEEHGQAEAYFASPEIESLGTSIPTGDWLTRGPSRRSL